MIDERNIARDAAILDAATHLTKQHGLLNFSRGQVAEMASVSRAGVSNYGRSRITNGPQGTAGVLDRIRNDVVARAVEQADLAVLCAGVAACHPIALAAPADMRIAALASAA